MRKRNVFIFLLLAMFLFQIGTIHAEEKETLDVIGEKEELTDVDFEKQDPDVFVEPSSDKEIVEKQDPSVFVDSANQETQVSNEEPGDKQDPSVFVAPSNNEDTAEEKKEPESPKSETIVSNENNHETGDPTISTGDDTNPGDDVHGGEIYDIQKVKVITKKVDSEGNFLSGVTLQILDSEGNVVDEWVTTDEAHETLLPDGVYTLHEVEALDGYDLAEDQEFTVKVEIVDLDSGADFMPEPCSHYGGTPMYYIEIEGKKHEVYCINQNWETPDENSTYDGGILNSESIRDFTKQTIVVDVDPDSIDPVDGREHSGQILSEEPVDVSDQSLSDQELYDKILDIIYHRHNAQEALKELGYSYTEEEIRYITEVALKNYTNSGLTERQFNVDVTETLLNDLDAAGVVYKTYNDGKKLSYIKHNYRDYVYVEDAAPNESIVRVDYGKGNSFGQMVASHWSSKHGANNSGSEKALAARATVARYYALYQYLTGDGNPHPSDMNLYIYSSGSIPSDVSINDHDTKYQNLLGVTGYFEDIPQQEQEVVMVNVPHVPTNNPETADPILTYVCIQIMSIFCLSICMIYSKKVYSK